MQTKSKLNQAYSLLRQNQTPFKSTHSTSLFFGAAAVSVSAYLLMKNNQNLANADSTKTQFIFAWGSCTKGQLGTG
jgi:alpha-tubulin suppressor-like RCC1 family protein